MVHLADLAVHQANELAQAAAARAEDATTRAEEEARIDEDIRSADDAACQVAKMQERAALGVGPATEAPARLALVIANSAYTRPASVCRQRRSGDGGCVASSRLRRDNTE